MEYAPSPPLPRGCDKVWSTVVQSAGWSSCDWSKVSRRQQSLWLPQQPGCNVLWIWSYFKQGLGEVFKVVEMPTFQPQWSILKCCCLTDNFWLVVVRQQSDSYQTNKKWNIPGPCELNFPGRKKQRETMTEINRGKLCLHMTTKTNNWILELKNYRSEPNQMF